MLQDKLIFGALAGVVADLVMSIPELALWKLKILPHPLFHYAASLFLAPDNLHRSYLGELVGFIASKVYGAFLGVVFIYLLVYTGRRYFLSKGLIYGAFLWLVSYCGLATLPVVKLDAVHPRMPLKCSSFSSSTLFLGRPLAL